MTDYDQVKEQVTSQDLAERLGLKVQGNRTAATWRGGDNPTSVIFNSNGTWYDYGEGPAHSSSCIDLYMKVKNTTAGEALRAIAEMYGIPLQGSVDDPGGSGLKGYDWDDAVPLPAAQSPATGSPEASPAKPPLPFPAIAATTPTRQQAAPKKSGESKVDREWLAAALTYGEEGSEAYFKSLSKVKIPDFHDPFAQTLAVLREFERRDQEIEKNLYLMGIQKPIFTFIGHFYDSGRQCAQTAGEWARKIKDYRESVLKAEQQRRADIFRAYCRDIPFVACNPVGDSPTEVQKSNGETRDSYRCKENVIWPPTAILVECDELDKDQQLKLLRCLQKCGFVIRYITSSGGKSVHAWIAPSGIATQQDWTDIVKGKLFPLLGKLGVDTACKDPSRYSRLAGVWRCDPPNHKTKTPEKWRGFQELIYLDYQTKPAKTIDKACMALRRIVDIASIRDELATQSVAGRFDAFLEGIRRYRGGTPTGFFYLDNCLGGGLRPGELTIMGGLSSIGKTTVGLQIVDDMAKRGQPVIIFSLEMGAAELMAKSVSRITAAESDEQAKTTSIEVINGPKHQTYPPQKQAAITKALEAYRTIGEAVCIIEGYGDMTADKIVERTEDYIAVKGCKPVVFIDYLQLIKPPDPKIPDKQAIDDAVSALKRMARDLGIVVIAVSSFNRSSYQGEASMASFKESGAIEYSADVLLAVQLAASACIPDPARRYHLSALQTVKGSTPRRVEIVILKQRNGQTGGKSRFDYDPRYNVFTEILDVKRSSWEDMVKKEFAEAAQTAKEATKTFAGYDWDDKVSVNAEPPKKRRPPVGREFDPLALEEGQ